MIFEKVENLAANLHDEIEYVINIKTLKEALIWMNLGNQKTMENEGNNRDIKLITTEAKVNDLL